MAFAKVFSILKKKISRTASDFSIKHNNIRFVPINNADPILGVACLETSDAPGSPDFTSQA